MEEEGADMLEEGLAVDMTDWAGKKAQAEDTLEEGLAEGMMGQVVDTLLEEEHKSVEVEVGVDKSVEEESHKSEVAEKVEHC